MILTDYQGEPGVGDTGDRDRDHTAVALLGEPAILHEAVAVELVGRHLEAGAGDIIDGDIDIRIDGACGRGSRGGDCRDVAKVDSAAIVQREIDLAIELVVIDVEVDVEESDLHVGGRVAAIAAGVDLGGGRQIGVVDEEIVVAIDDINADVGGIPLAIEITFGDVSLHAGGEIDIQTCIQCDWVGE